MSDVFIDRVAVSIGADPEFFIKQGDDFISGHQFPCGIKEKPRKTDHGAVQCDGVALEVNVEPAFSERAFVLNLRGVMFDLTHIVRGWNGEAYIVAESVAPFKSEYLKSLPASVRALGCNTDYNAYTADVNPKPSEDVPFRTGAGHLHIGWTEKAEGFEHFEKCCKLVKQLDYTVGLQTLMFDTDSRRRMLYGKAGAFRPKPYGLEYRVPSNVWCASEKLAGSMYRGCIKAIDLLNDGVDLDKETEGLAREIIDKNEVDWMGKYPKLYDLCIDDAEDVLPPSNTTMMT